MYLVGKCDNFELYLELKLFSRDHSSGGKSKFKTKQKNKKKQKKKQMWVWAVIVINLLHGCHKHMHFWETIIAHFFPLPTDNLISHCFAVVI